MLEDDPSLAVVAHDIEYDRIPVVLQAHRPDVLILDVDQVIDLAIVRELSAAHPDTHLVLLGDGLSALESAQLLAFGASACLGKATQAPRRAQRDPSRLPRAAGHAARRPRPGRPAAGGVLTQREGDVLLLLRQDRSNAQIALTLQIGIETVRTHARSVYRKLGVASRRALIAAA